MAFGEDAGRQVSDEDLVDSDGRLLDVHRYDYAGRCWWCGQQADSGEHKHKRTDLVREFGRGPWKDQTAVVQIAEGKPRDLQSPGSARLKFSRVLCGNCNSSRSQRFDQAYEQFADYITREEQRILENSAFRWSHIFGTDWKAGRNLVTAYWLKHMGCRFADGGVEVDARIVTFLNDPGQIRDVPVHMQLQIHEDLEAMTSHLRRVHKKDLPSLWIGGLMCEYSRSQRRVCQAVCHVGFRWLRLTYEWKSEYSRASINFWSDKVRLARFYNVGPRSVVENCGFCRDTDAFGSLPTAGPGLARWPRQGT